MKEHLENSLMDSYAKELRKYLKGNELVTTEGENISSNLLKHITELTKCVDIQLVWKDRKVEVKEDSHQLELFDTSTLL
jgi:hypothetical protein